MTKNNTTFKVTIQQAFFAVLTVLLTINTYFFFEIQKNTTSMVEHAERLKAVENTLHTHNLNNTEVVERVSEAEITNAIQDTKIDHLAKGK